jgi:hypothetical protein
MNEQRAAAAAAMRRATEPKEKQPATPELPYAYALIEEAPGRFSAVLLEGVTARTMTRLEVNGDPEPPARAMVRATSAIERRTIAKKWGKP